MFSRAQGTIEYLVVLAVVVVASLIAVGVVSDIFGSSGSIVQVNSGKLGSTIGSGGISVVDSITDSSGEALLSLRNDSANPITINAVESAGGTVSYNHSLSGGGRGSFVINPPSSSCLCSPGEVTHSCSYTIHFTTSDGLQKTSTITSVVDCVGDTTGGPGAVYALGSIQNPYKIDSCSELQDMNIHLDGNFVLDGDIDCSGTRTWNGGAGFKPVGTSSAPFTGSLKGNGNTVSNLFISSSSAYTGLFGYYGGVLFSELTLADANIYSSADYTGVLAGYSTKDINEVNVDGNVYAKNYAGGVIGRMNGELMNASFAGNVTGSGYVGGIIGYGANNIYGATVDGNINTIDNISVYDRSGGIVGYFIPGSGITKSITRSSFDGNVNGVEYAGGIAGYAGNGDSGGNTNLVNTYSSGTISGAIAAGGVLGGGYHVSIDKSYSKARIEGGDSGGLIGTQVISIISNSFFAGVISPSGTRKGGLAGYYYISDLPVNSYFDVNKAGVGFSCCSGGACSCGSVSDNNSGYSTYWFTKTNSPLSSWDFDIVWSDSPSNFPSLRALDYYGEACGTCSSLITCEAIEDESSCNAAGGHAGACYWSADYCYNSYTCSSFSSGTECGARSGCTWSPQVCN